MALVRSRGDTIVSQTALAVGYSYDLCMDNIALAGLQLTYTDATPGSAKTFISGVREVDIITLASKAGTTDGDYFTINDTNGNRWAIALDTTGSASNAPSGAVYTAVATGKKAYVDIHTATTAAQVCALVKTAIDALTGFTTVITSVDNGDGTLTFTAAIPGLVSTPQKHNKSDGGNGSTSFSISVAGTVPKVDPTTNYITIASHGFYNGLKVAATTSSSLPTGLSTTNYYVIVVDSNTIELATSAANAVLGTAVDITGYGVGTHTLTPAALGGIVIKLQASNDATNYADVASYTVTISAAGTTNWSLVDYAFRYVRILHTPSAGALTFSVVLNAKAWT